MLLHQRASYGAPAQEPRANLPALRKDMPLVECASTEGLNRDACFKLSIHDAPLYRRCSSILGQQGRMDVERAERWKEVKQA